MRIALTRAEVFWAVRKLDIYVGAMLGLPLTLSDEDVDQEFPIEVDDEYVTKDGILPQPEGEVSLMTAFNKHTRLVLILRKIVRTVYPIKVQNQPQDKSYSVPFSAIREIESEMEEWKKSLPSILNPGPGPTRYTRVQQLLRLSYAHAQVMLYRPFLHFTAMGKRGKHMDGRAYACAMSYVNVSRNIIHITTQMKQKGLLNGAFWFICYTSFFSVLSLVYFAAENPDNATTQAVMKDALEGKQVLAALAKGSLAADRCTATLDSVFQHLPAWMQAGTSNPQMPRKRHLDEDTQVYESKSMPQVSKSHTDMVDAKPDVSIPNLHQRAATFPRQNAQVPVNGSPTVTASYGSSPWSNSGASMYGSQSANGFDTGVLGPPFQETNLAALGQGLQQYPSLPPSFANTALPDLSTIMFPTADEPFQYPNQPLTTFENTQQFAMDQAINAVDNASPRVAPPFRGMDDNIEARFLDLPPYIAQRQCQQQQQMAFNGVDYNNCQSVAGMQMPNGMPNASSDINIQALFSDEWNSMLMNPIGYQNQ